MSSRRPLGRIFFATFLLLCLLCQPVAASSASGSIPMLDVDGLVKKVAEEGKGKVVIMTVFASWCPPCKKEMPMLVETRKVVDETNLMLIGLSSDESIRDLNEFIKKYRVNFPVYTGTGELFQALGISGIPHMFIFNRKGELVESVVGLIPEPTFKMILAKLLSEPGA